MPLTPDEFGVLAFLREYGPTSVEHLAKTSYQDQTDILRYLSGLQKKSLVRKTENGEFEITNGSAGNSHKDKETGNDNR